MRGEFLVEFKNIYTCKKQIYQFNNIITDIGLDSFAGANWSFYPLNLLLLNIGSGNNLDPLATDQYLENCILVKNGAMQIHKYATIVGNSIVYQDKGNAFVVSANYLPTEGNGLWAEGGLGKAYINLIPNPMPPLYTPMPSGTSLLFNRALFTDYGILPSPLTPPVTYEYCLVTYDSGSLPVSISNNISVNVNDATNKSTNQLDWTAVAGIAVYKIFRKTNVGTFNFLIELDNTHTRYYDNGRTPENTSIHPPPALPVVIFLNSVTTTINKSPFALTKTLNYSALVCVNIFIGE